MSSPGGAREDACSCKPQRIQVSVTTAWADEPDLCPRPREESGSTERCGSISQATPLPPRAFPRTVSASQSPPARPFLSPENQHETARPSAAAPPERAVASWGPLVLGPLVTRPSPLMLYEAGVIGRKAPGVQAKPPSAARASPALARTVWGAAAGRRISPITQNSSAIRSYAQGQKTYRTFNWRMSFRIDICHEDR